MTRARNRSDEHFVWRILRRVNPPDVGLDEQGIRMHGLPDIGKTWFDFDAGDELEIAMVADGRGKGAATGEHLQRAPWWATGALALNRERSDGRGDFEKATRTGYFDFVPHCQRREERTICQIDDGAQSTRRTALRDLVRAAGVLSQSNTAGNRFHIEAVSGDEAQRREPLRFQPHARAAAVLAKFVK